MIADPADAILLMGYYSKLVFELDLIPKRTFIIPVFYTK